MPPRHSLRLLLTALLLAAALLPARAEYGWNPFNHLTEAESVSLACFFLLLAVLGLVPEFVLYPLLLGGLAYWVLRRTCPAPQVRLRLVLLGAWLATIAAVLLATLTTSWYAAMALQLAAPVAGAALSYFWQRQLLVRRLPDDH